MVDATPTSTFACAGALISAMSGFAFPLGEARCSEPAPIR
jgi:hypothetical protein